MIRRWAKRILRADLANHRDLVRQLDERNRELFAQTERQAAAHRRLLDERDRLCAVANGATRSRLETELLRRWAELSVELDEPPRHGDASERAGEVICRKVPLHSPNEVARFIAKLRRETGYPEDVEGYHCPICPRHPLVGRIRHVRHRTGAERRLSPTQRAELRAHAPLTQPLAPELLARVRAQLERSTGA